MSDNDIAEMVEEYKQTIDHPDFTEHAMKMNMELKSIEDYDN